MNAWSGKDEAADHEPEACGFGAMVKRIGEHAAADGFASDGLIGRRRRGLFRGQLLEDDLVVLRRRERGLEQGGRRPPVLVELAGDVAAVSAGGFGAIAARPGRSAACVQGQPGLLGHGLFVWAQPRVDSSVSSVLIQAEQLWRGPALFEFPDEPAAPPVASESSMATAPLCNLASASGTTLSKPPASTTALRRNTPNAPEMMRLPPSRFQPMWPRSGGVTGRPRRRDSQLSSWSRSRMPSSTGWRASTPRRVPISMSTGSWCRASRTC